MLSLPFPLGSSPLRSSGSAFDQRFRSAAFPNATPAQSVPVCSLLSSDGQVVPAKSTVFYSNGNPMLGHRFDSGQLFTQTVVRDDGRDPRSQNIAARVMALDLSAAPTMPMFSSHHGFSLMGENAVPKAPTGQDWIDAAANGGYAPGGMWQMPNTAVAPRNDLSQSFAEPFGAGLSRNLMWGFTDSRAGADTGHEWTDLHSPMEHGSEGWTTSGGTSSLASSRSLPDLTWASNDPRLSRSGTEWLRDDPDEEKLSKREAMHDPEQDHRRQTQPVSWTSNVGTSSNAHPSPAGATMGASLGVGPSTSSGTVMLDRLPGGRIEEGSIGSKKRIWYRAPNGQFASATQALSGSFPGDSNGDGGQGSSQGSSEGFRRIRRRRKSEEVERKYRCDYEGCDKAYGTLNRE